MRFDKCGRREPIADGERATKTFWMTRKTAIGTAVTALMLGLLAGCGGGTDSQPMVHERSQESASETFISAAERGDLAAVKRYLEKGADVNAKGGYPEWSALGAAVQAGHDSVVEFLIASKADVNARSVNENTPLHLAALNGRKRAAKLLIAAGANVNAKDNDGGTPLHDAVSQGHKDVVELLIAKGAAVNARTVSMGWTPLGLAAEMDEDDIAGFLREHGARE
jgi:ankyrin repeat protein